MVSESGTSSEKRPFLSVLARVDSCMPWARRMRTTSSPAAGLLVVLLMTVPVMEAASAEPVRAAKARSARAKRLGDFVECKIMRRVTSLECEGGGSGAGWGWVWGSGGAGGGVVAGFEPVELGDDLRGFVLKAGALDGVVGLGML